jgi:hypothetical protein
MDLSILFHRLGSRHGMFPHGSPQLEARLMSRLQHLWYNSVYWLNNAELWTAWPSREMSGFFKWYYLIQLSFCAQQLLAIHMEARRKDYVEMLTHHIITCSLISITYVYRYTRAANVVLCLMDLVDILLPVSAPSLLNGSNMQRILTQYPIYLVRQTPPLFTLRSGLQSRLRNFRRNLVHHSPRYISAPLLGYL